MENSHSASTESDPTSVYQQTGAEVVPHPDVSQSTDKKSLIHRKSRALLIIIFLMLLFVGIGLAGFYFFRQSVRSTKTVYPSPPNEFTAETPLNTDKPAEVIITPNPINPLPTKAPKTENEFYLQVGSAFKEVFK